MTDKIQLSAWAYSVIRDHVERGSYGNVVVSMTGGVITNVKAEINHKPEMVDALKK